MANAPIVIIHISITTAIALKIRSLSLRSFCVWSIYQAKSGYFDIIASTSFATESMTL